jgi:hypothetical protein
MKPNTVTRTVNQGFSDRCSGCSWIAVIICGFRDCKRLLFVVILGYLDMFCDHKVSNDHWLTVITDDLDAGGRVASRRSGGARPRGSPGAALDGTGACVAWALPPGWRVVALGGGRGDATPCLLGPAAAVLVADYPGGLPPARARLLRLTAMRPPLASEDYSSLVSVVSRY